MPKTPVVDVHAHFIPEALLPSIGSGKFEGLALEETGGKTMLVIRGRRISPATPRHRDLSLRIAPMDKMGVDVEAVSVVPPLVGYHLPVDQAVPYCRLINDSIAEAISAYSKRFVGLANVPLQDPGSAVRELSRAVEDLGMKGAQVGANVNAEDLGEERFLAFWEAAAGLDCFVFFHPNQASLPAVERMKRYHLHNLIGNPLDTSLAIASLIFGGVLERWPNLKLCFAHAGGFVPYQIGRFDHAYGAREDVHSAIPEPPSHYFRRLYFDTISHGRDALAFLVSKVGTGQVLLGTDYPADMADDDPVKSVAGLALDPAGAAQVLGGNATRLLGLDVESR